MNKDNTINQARFIATTGKLLHDYLLRCQADQVMIRCKDSRFGDATVSQIHVINSIRMRGKVSMKELSTMLNVTPPSATAMVDRLVEKEILIREHSTRDRRVVVVRVSDEAEKYIQALEESVMKSCLRLVRKLGPETTKKWCEVLGQVKLLLESESGIASSDFFNVNP